MLRNQKKFLSGIASKLALLAGGAIALTATGTTAQTIATTTDLGTESVASAQSVGLRMPAKLILKQQRSGFRLLAQHDSHSSHGSHASHASHSSSSF